MQKLFDLAPVSASMTTTGGTGFTGEADERVWSLDGTTWCLEMLLSIAGEGQILDTGSITVESSAGSLNVLYAGLTLTAVVDANPHHVAVTKDGPDVALMVDEALAVRRYARLLAALLEPRQLGEDAVWFGSRAARLVAAPGETEPFLSCRYPNERAMEYSYDGSAAATLARAAPLVAPDGDPRPVVVPCIPSLELVVPAGGGEGEGEDGGEGGEGGGGGGGSGGSGCAAPLLPAELRRPLVKAALLEADDGGADDGDAAPSGMCVIASGTRSALARPSDSGSESPPDGPGGRWWRIKGCGNGDGPFSVRLNGPSGALQGGADGPHSGAREGWRDVRGCCFVHTARREMHMSALLGRALRSSGCIGANAPAAAWLYSGAALCPFGEAPLYRSAAVVEVMGESA